MPSGPACTRSRYTSSRLSWASAASAATASVFSIFQRLLKFTHFVKAPAPKGLFRCFVRNLGEKGRMSLFGFQGRRDLAGDMHERRNQWRQWFALRNEEADIVADVGID